MALKDLLALSERHSAKHALTEERVRAQIEPFRDMISFWREYPDYFIDVMKGPDSTFNLFFYQRVFLRAAIRHKFVYAVFPRAFSKSFLSLIILMTRAVLFPGAHLFISTGGKEQSAAIVQAKVSEICKVIPGFHNEIDWRPGVSTKSKDQVRYTFKNGSIIQNVAANERSRGLRFHGGLLEECITIPQDILNEVLIPMTNVSRSVNGKFKAEEILNKSQIYVTTAGYKNTFAYEKHIQLLVQQITRPGESFIMGGTWMIPVMEGLLDKDFVKQLKLDGTFNEASFEREYGSKWSGDAENAFFSADKFDKHRILKLAENEYNNRSSKNAFYILGVDVARKADNTEVMVIKITPQPQGASLKSLVNIFTFEKEHFEQQAIEIKRLFLRYRAKIAVVDGNGLGMGLIDYLVKDQTDTDGSLLPNFGVVNDEEGFYKNFQTADTISNAMYILKANAPINSEAHVYVQTQLGSGKIKFLIDENQAKVKLLESQKGRKMTSEERAVYLRPYVLTTVLREQMLNLVEEHENINIILKQSNRKIKKDKFSAFEYALYWVKLKEDKDRKRKKRNLADFMFFTSK